LLTILKFGWTTIRHHQSDPLASDSDDEKDLSRAEKEVRKDVETKCQHVNNPPLARVQGSGQIKRAAAVKPQ